MNRQRLRRLGSFLTAAAFSLTLTGCSIPRVIGSVDTLLTPPRLTDDQNDIYDALSAHLSGDSMHLVYPQKGENLSAFIFCNLDADPSDEAVVFYQQTTSSTAAAPISMAVLDLVTGSWQVVSETELEGSAVEDVTLLSADGAQLLAQCGFEVEDLGLPGLVVRGAPTYLQTADIPFVLSEMAGQLAEAGGAGSTVLDGLLASIACKAAIKGGSDSDMTELQRLAEQVLMLPDVRNCPHGRPVAVRMSRLQLEKQFKRVL